MAEYAKEINRRRTFAIISHPDAGKTTLTEKFLLYGGAINLAGSVKGKQLKTPEGMHTRPTTDRVKEALFSIIQFDVPGKKVLDLFGGTG